MVAQRLNTSSNTLTAFAVPTLSHAKEFPQPRHSQVFPSGAVSWRIKIGTPACGIPVSTSVFNSMTLHGSPPGTSLRCEGPTVCAADAATVSQRRWTQYSCSEALERSEQQPCLFLLDLTVELC